MRNPNGYGSVSKLTGNRRKPYLVRVTTGWDFTDEDKPRQKLTTLGCYATREEAMLALAEYHKGAFDIPVDITLEQLYNRWSADKYNTISKSSAASYKSAWKACEPLYGEQFADLKLAHLQGLINTCGKNLPTLKNIKILLTQLYSYAIKNDIVQKDYAHYIDLAAFRDDEDDEDIHKAFSPAELTALWANVGADDWVSVILMLVYSGVRVGELLALNKADVNLQERYFNVRKSKTKSGVRKVPIAAKVLPYWEYWYNLRDTAQLITMPNGKPVQYRQYRRAYFDPIMDILHLDSHLPHDTRHTCVSMLAEAKVQPAIIKRIVGHKTQDITDSVYTHLDFNILLEAIDSI